MKIFDPHVHMISRTTDDYEKMALSGIETIVEPAFWLGEPRKHAGSFFDYFDHITHFEVDRAAQYGIKHYATIAVNPREANDKKLTDEVLAEMPKWLSNKWVVAVGEIGFDRITEAEEQAFRRQVEMAFEHGLPVLIHTPHRDKPRGTQKTIEILRDMKVDMAKILIDHNTEETIEMSRKSGAWSGHTVYPVTKLSPERMANILGKHGVDKMLVNSAADWGPSDALSVPRVVVELRKRAFPEAAIQKLVWQNPHDFFAQSGRL
jgi:uncharacterized protein